MIKFCHLKYITTVYVCSCTNCRCWYASTFTVKNIEDSHQGYFWVTRYLHGYGMRTTTWVGTNKSVETVFKHSFWHYFSLERKKDRLGNIARQFLLCRLVFSVSVQPALCSLPTSLNTLSDVWDPISVQYVTRTCAH